MNFDIVITWVDWSNKNFVNKLIEAGGRSESCEYGKFLELKYLLRSLEKHNVNYRKIHIVHSDNHPPPKYLKETKRLRFVSHSELVTDMSHLPLIHRQSIWAHLHKIPDLTNIFFYMEDDYFIMNPKIFEHLLNNYNNKRIFINMKRLKKKYDVTKSCGLWFQSMVNSRNLIKNDINESQYILATHWIKIFDKSVLEELETLYPKQFLATQTYKDQKKEKEKEKDIICEACIFLNYLVYKKKYKVINSNELNIMVIHTNGYTNKTDLTNLKNKLQESKSKWMLNAQGNGISDEYPKCETVHNMFYKFLEETFPMKSKFEISLDKDNKPSPPRTMEKPCAVCSKPAWKKCGRCHQTTYCSVVCQHKHWKATHKHSCRQLAESAGPSIGTNRTKTGGRLDDRDGLSPAPV